MIGSWNLFLGRRFGMRLSSWIGQVTGRKEIRMKRIKNLRKNLNRNLLKSSRNNIMFSLKNKLGRKMSELWRLSLSLKLRRNKV